MYVHIRKLEEEDSKFPKFPDSLENPHRERNKMHSLMIEETVAKFDDEKAYAKQEKEVFVSQYWSEPKSSGTDAMLSSVTAEKSSFSILFTAIHR